MHRFLALVPALLLVFVQQAALAHSITHIGETTESSRPEAPQQPQHDAEAFCKICLAFSPIAGAVGSSPPGLAPVHLPHLDVALAPLPPAIPEAPVYRSRAPPSVF